MNLDIQQGANLKTLQLEAKEFFAGHYNCAQGTFLPFALRYGLSKDIAAKLALPFGGGMSQSGQVCGAVSGGLLAIGLVRGISEDDPHQKALCDKVAKSFISQFFTHHAEISCPGLLGYDLNEPSGKMRRQESNFIQTPCSKFVENAVEIVNQLLSIEV